MYQLTSEHWPISLTDFERQQRIGSIGVGGLMGNPGHSHFVLLSGCR
jgi:hypothetical protein